MFVGEKYEATRDLSMKVIAAMIRHDIQEAAGAGTLPRGFRATVRRPHYNELIITVRRMGEGFLGALHERRTVTNALTALADRYNRDDSRIEEDHFDTRFYVYVRFSPDIKFV